MVIALPKLWEKCQEATVWSFLGKETDQNHHRIQRCSQDLPFFPELQIKRDFLFYCEAVG
jgi:hypothetical protein